MRITQGTFSFLPDLTDDEIEAQLRYALGNGWAINIEFTDDPHPRNVYWDMWGPPMFDLGDPGPAMAEIAACRNAHGDSYIRVSAFDASTGWETLRLSFLVNRPKVEKGFHLARQEGRNREIRYTITAR